MRSYAPAPTRRLRPPSAWVCWSDGCCGGNDPMNYLLGDAAARPGDVVSVNTCEHAQTTPPNKTVVPLPPPPRPSPRTGASGTPLHAAAQPGAPLIIPRGAGELFDRAGFGFHWKIDGNETGGRFS